MSRSLLAVCLLVLISLSVAQNSTCFDSFPPGPNDDMPTCCWYSDSTCCPSSNAGLVGLLSNLGTLSNTLYNNVTDNGQNTSEELKTCMSYYENAMCSFCDPSSPLIMPVLDSDVPLLVVCDSFCVDWYDACANVPEIMPRFAANNITSGEALCTFFPEAISEHVGSVLFNVTVESEYCFEGVDPVEVLSSPCLPWVEQPVTPSTNSTPPAGNYSSPIYTSDGEGDGDGDGNPSLFWLFFLLAAVVFVLLVVVVIVVGFVLWKRRQAAAAVTTDSNAYPDLDELDDYE